MLDLIELIKNLWEMDSQGYISFILGLLLPLMFKFFAKILFTPFTSKANKKKKSKKEGLGDLVFIAWLPIFLQKIFKFHINQAEYFLFMVGYLVIFVGKNFLKRYFWAPRRKEVFLCYQPLGVLQKAVDIEETSFGWLDLLLWSALLVGIFILLRLLNFF